MAIFNLHDFVMRTLLGMAEQYSEFQVREFALNWYQRSVLTDEDLAEIESWYAPDEPQTIPETEVMTHA